MEVIRAAGLRAAVAIVVMEETAEGCRLRVSANFDRENINDFLVDAVMMRERDL
jgi:hypothetical protein